MTSTSAPVVVTGAASGVGRAAVETLVARGVPVVALDRTPMPAPGGGVALAGDVTDPASWRRVRDAAEQLDPGGAGALITCAGLIRVSPLLHTPASEFRQLFEVNVMGVLLGLQELLPAMIARGDGAVAAVCSVDSLFVEESMSAYATSKGALLQLVRSAAVEHARHGVRINAVCPGAIDTPLLHQHLETMPDPAAAKARIENVTPAGRLLAPQEIADLLLYLISPQATAMSGAAVVVDGGLTSTYDFRLP
jgi:NAD(P)-dependent dehydrogenase (short-subunit alcohol dehydrogenase family)